MILPECPTIDHAVNALVKLRAYRPFQYGGTWFVSTWQGEGRAYRSMKSLKTAAGRFGLDKIDVVKLKGA